MRPSVAHYHASGFLKYRYALWNLVLKDFRVRYRNMSLGFMWSVLNPLVMLGVLVFVFTYIVGKGGPPGFTLRILVGIILFNFFSMCISPATTCIAENGAIVKKVIFPRQIIPISVVLAQVIHLVIQLALLLVFIILFKVPITRFYLWLVPVFAVEMILIMGASLICATLNVYFNDWLYLVQSGLTVLFWFTPIFYTLKDAHANLPLSLYALYLLNPLVGCVDGARAAILYRSPPDAFAFGMAAVSALTLLGIGVIMFRRMNKNFADHI